MYVPYEWKDKIQELRTIDPETTFSVMYSGGKDAGLALSMMMNHGKLHSLIHCEVGVEIFSPNLTGEYVSRIEKKALSKLREKFDEK